MEAIGLTIATDGTAAALIFGAVGAAGLSLDPSAIVTGILALADRFRNSRWLLTDRHEAGVGRTGANGQPEIEQYSINGSQAYVFDDPTTGQPLGIVTSADQACMLVFDGTDNPVGLLTNSASVAFTYKYDPWGVQTLTADGTGSGAGQNPYAFHAGIKDPGSGLVKFGLRWYNPITGTWTQQDTPDAPLDPANANRYAYAGDDPINNLNPSGRLSEACGNAIGVFAFSDILEIFTAIATIAASPTGLGAVAGIGVLVAETGLTYYTLRQAIDACS